LFDLFGLGRSEDEEDLTGALEWPSEANDAFGLQRVHENAMGLPLGLGFKSSLGIVGRTISANDDEKLLLGYHSLRVAILPAGLNFRLLIHLAAVDFDTPQARAARTELPRRHA